MEDYLDNVVQVNGIIYENSSYLKERLERPENIEIIEIEVDSDEDIGYLKICFNSKNEFIIKAELDQNTFLLDSGEENTEDKHFNQEGLIEGRFIFHNFEFAKEIVYETVQNGVLNQERKWIEITSPEDELVDIKPVLSLNGIDYSSLKEWEIAFERHSNIEHAMCMRGLNCIIITAVKNEGYIIEFSEIISKEMKTYMYDNGSNDKRIVIAGPDEHTEDRFVCKTNIELLEIVRYMYEKGEKNPNYNWIQKATFNKSDLETLLNEEVINEENKKKSTIGIIFFIIGAIVLLILILIRLFLII